jgi:transcriptional regulator with XRE-family HTH domain
MTPETLKAWRARLSLGEAGMAAYLGVPVTTYRKWENGTRNPDAAPLRLFAVLGEVEGCAPELHTRLLAEIAPVAERPSKGRKPRATTLAPTPVESQPVPPWIHAVDALPSWMKGESHA